MMYKRFTIEAYPGITGWFCRYWPVENDSAESGQTTIEHEDRPTAIQAAKAQIDNLITMQKLSEMAEQPAPALADPLDTAFNHLYAGQFNEGSALALFDIAQSLRRLAPRDNGQGGPVRNPPPGAVAALLAAIDSAMLEMENLGNRNDPMEKLTMYRKLVHGIIKPGLDELLKASK